MSIPSHQAAIGVARPGIPNTVTNTDTAFIMISLSGVSYQTNHHHQSYYHDHHHFMMNISEIYQKHFHIRERFIEKRKKKIQTNVCFALTPTYVQ